MRFSTIIREYYRIQLPLEDHDLLDIHFSGAAHHRALAFSVPNASCWNFHFHFYYRHLFALMSLIYHNAEFSVALDPCEEGMNQREH